MGAMTTVLQIIRIKQGEKTLLDDLEVYRESRNIIRQRWMPYIWHPASDSHPPNLYKE